MLASLDLTPIWTFLIGFAVLAYVVLDGFDLGCGILFLTDPNDEDRDTIVNTIAPVWDGNETWLILGGGGLFAVFPLAYAILMPAFYPLIILMLLALVFRGVAFEFRFRTSSLAGKHLWDLAFCGGSLIAAMCQGMVLGGLLQGVEVSGRAYAGGWWDWLTPFTVLCGLAVVVGYALLGATWIIWRTEGKLHEMARRQATPLAALLLALMFVVTIWSPAFEPTFLDRWFGWPTVLFCAPVPLLVALLAWVFWRSLARDSQLVPFLCVLGWFVLGFLGLAVSVAPMMIPPSVTIWDAAAPHESQLFLLVGALVLVPMILAYIALSYWVFRGKVRPGLHYH